MAITWGDSNWGGGTSGTGNRTSTFSATVGWLMVIVCNVKNNTNTAPTCSDDQGGTYDLITAFTYNGGADTFSCFVRKQRLTSSTGGLVTVATGANDSGIVSVLSVAGSPRDSSGAVLQFATSTGAAGATPAATFAAAAGTGNMTIVAVGNGSNPANMTPPTNWSEHLSDSGTDTPNCGVEHAERSTGFTGTTITWGGTSATAYAAIILELNATDIVDPVGTSGFFGI